MRTLGLQKIRFIFLFIVVLGALQLHAEDKDKNKANARIINKARDAVKSAGPSDWYTLAISAQKCIDKKTNLEEAVQWLRQSMEIRETSINLEVMGDYLMTVGAHIQAIEYYVKSMNAGKMNDFYFDGSNLQAKIAEAQKKK